MKRYQLTAVVCLVGLAISSHAAAQDELRAVRTQTVGGNVDTFTLDDRVIANTPFSADATTTVTQTLGDGTKLEQRTTAKLYRDSTGRVRREQTVIGLDRLNPAATPQTTITFDSVPGDPAPYTLNAIARTARRGPRGVQWLTGAGLYVAYTLNGDRRAVGVNPPLNAWRSLELSTSRGAQTASIPPDLKPTEESLGTRQIEGVKATGRRKTTVIPAGRIGNDRAIQVIEEQWDSPELNMVISSRFSDPRTGVVEYRMTNINRAEPRADLFAVPSDYTVVDTGAAYLGAIRGAGPGQTQPAPGGRRGRSQ